MAYSFRGSGSQPVARHESECGPSWIRMQPTLLIVTVLCVEQLKNNFQFYN